MKNCNQCQYLDYIKRYPFGESLCTIWNMFLAYPVPKMVDCDQFKRKYS